MLTADAIKHNMSTQPVIDGTKNVNNGYSSTCVCADVNVTMLAGGNATD